MPPTCLCSHSTFGPRMENLKKQKMSLLAALCCTSGNHAASLIDWMVQCRSERMQTTTTWTMRELVLETVSWKRVTANNDCSHWQKSNKRYINSRFILFIIKSCTLIVISLRWKQFPQFCLVNRNSIFLSNRLNQDSNPEDINIILWLNHASR